MDFFLKSQLCLMLLPTKNAGFCFKLVYVNCSFFFFDEQAVSCSINVLFVLLFPVSECIAS